MKTTIRIFAGLALVLLILLVAGYFFTRNIHWNYLGMEKSPSGVFNAAIYNYQSDGDRHAPYGYYIYLQTSNLPSQRKGDLVFAGYCKTTPKVEWISDHQLIIYCEAKNAEDIRSLMSRIYGIGIQVNR